MQIDNDYLFVRTQIVLELFERKVIVTMFSQQRNFLDMFCAHIAFYFPFRNTSLCSHVFNNSRAATPLQIIFRGTHWIRFWALLQK